MPREATDLLQGTLELLILRLLRAGDLNGWDIMQRIRVMTGDVLSVTPGALYPALHRLEDRGWIASFWGTSDNNRRARYYRLTTAGRRALEAQTTRWQALTRAVNRILLPEPE